MRFHLIDRIDEVKYGHHITAVKCVTLADDVFNEHFPGHPVFPGTLILEGMAQLAGSFFEMTDQKKGRTVKRSILSIVNQIKFRKAVYPGDRLFLRADILTHREEYGVAKVRAEIDGEICAEGELTFSFVSIQDTSLDASRREMRNICMRLAKEIK